MVGAFYLACTLADGSAQANTVGQLIVPPLAVSTIALVLRGGDGGNNARPGLDFSYGGSGALLEIPCVARRSFVAKLAARPRVLVLLTRY